MQLINEEGNGLICDKIDHKHVRAISSPLAQKILKMLADNEDGLSAAAIAKTLHEHEQKIYYHVRKLLAAETIVIDHTEDTNGGTAKIIRLRAESYVFLLKKPHTILRNNLQKSSSLIAPFIESGKLNCTIIVGSPDPHGPIGARGRDAAYAIDLGIFLGSKLSVPAQAAVQLDTELHFWNKNLIIIGGPVVNKATEKINSKSPARYDVDRKEFIVGNKHYTQENVGVICKMKNPYAKGKWIMHLTGKRSGGTIAAILAFVNEFEKMQSFSTNPDGSFVRVVLGIDENSDGIVDNVQFLQ